MEVAGYNFGQSHKLIHVFIWSVRNCSLQLPSEITSTYHIFTGSYITTRLLLKRLTDMGLWNAISVDDVNDLFSKTSALSPLCRKARYILADKDIPDQQAEIKYLCSELYSADWAWPIVQMGGG